MSVHSLDPDHLYGAIRNAQLAPVVFPGWTVRVYVSSFNQSLFPQRIVSKLRALGAEVLEGQSDIPPEFWSYLTAWDPNMKYYLIRKPNFRLSSREFNLIEQWLNSKYNIHCIKDTENYRRFAITDGLLGVKTGTQENNFIIQALRSKVQNHITYNSTQEFLDNVYPQLKSSLLCHDSAHCEEASEQRSRAIVNFNLPLAEDEQRIGQPYHAYMQAVKPLLVPGNCSVGVQ